MQLVIDKNGTLKQIPLNVNGSNLYPNIAPADPVKLPKNDLVKPAAQNLSNTPVTIPSNSVVVTPPVATSTQNSAQNPIIITTPPTISSTTIVTTPAQP